MILSPSELRATTAEEFDHALMYFVHSLQGVVTQPFAVVMCQAGMAWFSRM